MEERRRNSDLELSLASKLQNGRRRGMPSPTVVRKPCVPKDSSDSGKESDEDAEALSKADSDYDDAKRDGRSRPHRRDTLLRAESKPTSLLKDSDEDRDYRDEI
jgi:hypothetical protein